MAQCLPLVQHGDGVNKRLTDRDLGAAKAVAFVLSGQLVFAVLELEGQVLRELARGM